VRSCEAAKESTPLRAFAPSRETILSAVAWIEAPSAFQFEDSFYTIFALYIAHVRIRSG
jgi:hypothetical protein